MTPTNEKSLITLLLPAWIAAFAVIIWGGGLLAVGNALSGPFSPLQWLSYIAVLLVVPLMVTLGFGRSASIAIRQGKISKGKLLAAFPLILLAIAAVFAWTFG